MKIVKTPIPKGAMGWSAIGEEEIEAVTAVLKDPEHLFRVRHDGKLSECSKLEKAICEKTGMKYSLFLASGTGALACCLIGYEIGPGDEVIVPAYTFIATPAAVIDVGAVPVIAEIDESLGMCPIDLEKKITPYTKAVIVVNMVGVPAKLDEIRAICKKHNLILIEDNCQAIGATYKGKHCGVESDASAWSTNFFKVITCGEGGVFMTNNPKAFQRGVYQSDNGLNDVGQGHPHSKNVKPFSRSGIRGNELAASVLNVQVGKMDKMLTHTRALKKRLLSQLTPINYKMQYVDDPEGDCGISFAIIMNSKDICKPFTEALEREGMNVGGAYSASFPDRHIYCYWDAIINDEKGDVQNYPWNNPAYKGTPAYNKDMCLRSLDILTRCLRIMIHLALTEKNVIEIADAINKADKAVV